MSFCLKDAVDFVLSWALDLLNLHLGLGSTAGTFSGVAETGPTQQRPTLLTAQASHCQKPVPRDKVPPWMCALPAGRCNPCAAWHMGPGLLPLYHPESTGKAENSLGYSTSPGSNSRLGYWGSMDGAFPAQPRMEREMGTATETSRAPVRERAWSWRTMCPAVLSSKGTDKQ